MQNTVKFKASEHVAMPSFMWAIVAIFVITAVSVVVDYIVGANRHSLSIAWDTKVMLLLRGSLCIFASIAVYLVYRYVVMFKATYSHPFLAMCSVKGAFNITDYAVYLNKFVFGVKKDGGIVNNGVVVSIPKGGVALRGEIKDLYLKDRAGSGSGWINIHQKLDDINHLMVAVGFLLAASMLSFSSLLIYSAIGAENGGLYFAFAATIAMLFLVVFMNLNLRTPQWWSVIFDLKSKYDHFITEAFDGLAVANMVQSARDAESLAAVNATVLKQHRYIVDIKYRFNSDVLWVLALVVFANALPYLALVVAGFVQEW